MRHGGSMRIRMTLPLNRRDFVARSTLGAFAAAMARLPFAHLGTDDVEIIDFADDGTPKGKIRVPKIVKTDAEWRTQLSPIAFFVARQGGTERSFSGAFWNLHTRGLFRCVCCDTALFSSAHKFDSGTGW